MAKKTSSAQKLLPRKPRVQIEYDVEIGDAQRSVELPWITGVMADLSGANSGDLPELTERSFSEVDAENFDTFLKDQKPRMTFAVDDTLSGEDGRLGVDVTLESMEDFSPDNFARKVGSEIIEILVEEKGTGSEKAYHFDSENPDSAQFGDSIESIDKLTPQFIAYKVGEKESDIECSVTPNPRKPKCWNLRVVKKGPLAKLLDARKQLSDLLIKVDGKAGAQEALEAILADKSSIEASLAAQNAPKEEA